jgi:putative acetyltransferase
MIKRGVPVVFLEGDPDYYSRFGFQAGGPQGFRKPSLRIPDAAFQAILLAAHEPWRREHSSTPGRSGTTIASGVAT